MGGERWHGRGLGGGGWRGGGGRGAGAGRREEVSCPTGMGEGPQGYIDNTPTGSRHVLT